MRNFPREADDITSEWLSEIMRNKVLDFKIRLMEGGVLAHAFQVYDIEYHGTAPDAPPSIVVKVASSEKANRDFALISHAYKKEINFYRHLANDVPIRVPTVYACELDDDDNCEYFVLALEDLTLHSKVFDQVDDPPNFEFAKKTALEAAKLHAKFWRSERLQLPWISGANNRYMFTLDPACKAASGAYASFLDLHREMYGCDIYELGDFESARELSDIICGPNSVAVIEKIYDALSSRPHTLLQGDMRADNLFRTVPAAGGSVEESSLTFIDWQLLQSGPPGCEFTQAWMHSLEPEIRQNDTKILLEYHKKLTELNPAASEYSYDDLLQDYALTMCLWWGVVIGIGTGNMPSFGKPENARMKNLWGKAFVRSMHAIRDLDTTERVKKLVSTSPDDGV